MTTPDTPTKKCPACAAGLWMPNCTYDATPEPTAYLDPVRDELDRLRDENTRYTAGADDTEKPENARPTAAQAWHTLLNLPANDRLSRLGALLDDAYDCDGYARRLGEAEARVDQLTDTLTLLEDTHRKRSAAHDRLITARLACPTCSTLPLEETPA